MEYALTARAVEAEVWELEHPDGESPKKGAQTFVINRGEEEAI